MDEHGSLSSFLYPSLTTLTPSLSSLNLLCLGGDGTGVSPQTLGYFGSPRLDRGSGSGMTPGKFFLFDSAGRTPSSTFSTSVSEVGSECRNKSSRSLTSTLKGRFNRTDFYRTGLTPATNETDSPLKISNNNTPLSDIGNISISSSVFSPSFSPYFSPRRSFAMSTDGKMDERERNREGEREGERESDRSARTNQYGNENNGNRLENDRDEERNRERRNERGRERDKGRDRDRERGSDGVAKSPHTDQALNFLAGCIGNESGHPVIFPAPHTTHSSAHSSAHSHVRTYNQSTHSSSLSPTPTPSSKHSTPFRQQHSHQLLNQHQNATLSAISIEKSFASYQKYFPMVSTDTYICFHCVRILGDPGKQKISDSMENLDPLSLNSS